MEQRAIFSIPFCPWPLYSDCHQEEQLWWWQLMLLSFTKYTELLGSAYAICCWCESGFTGQWLLLHPLLCAHSGHSFACKSASESSVDTHACEWHSINKQSREHSKNSFNLCVVWLEMDGPFPTSTFWVNFLLRAPLIVNKNTILVLSIGKAWTLF